MLASEFRQKPSAQFQISQNEAEIRQHNLFKNFERDLVELNDFDENDVEKIEIASLRTTLSEPPMLRNEDFFGTTVVLAKAF